MSRLRLGVALLLVACGASGPPPATAAAAPTPPAGETFECRLDRLAILDAMSASRAEHACTAATDCRAVMGPGHPDPEYAEVVHVADADTLEARASDHLARCGTFHHHEAIDAYREIEAACDDGHCVAHETLVHVDE